MIDLLPAQLLGCHVTHRAEEHAWLCVRGCRRQHGRVVGHRARGARNGSTEVRRNVWPQLRQAKIQNLHSTIRCADENVLRLEIAMDDVLAMRGRETVRDLDGVVDGLAYGESSALRTRGAARVQS